MSRFHAQILILLLGGLLFAGSGASSVEERVSDCTAEERRAAATAVGARIDQKSADTLRAAVDVRRDLMAALADYDVEDAELRAILDTGTRILEEGEEEILDLRFELRATMQADEWVELMEGMRDDKATMAW